MPAVMHSLVPIISDYIRCWRGPARAERLSFAREPTLEATISRAAICELSNGKRHPHQYRIPKDSLTKAKRRLLRQKEKIRNCASFEELYDLVNSRIKNIWMIGELAVYDIASRIGAYLHLEPEQVYLHRGTRDGARALGFHGPLAKLTINDLPREFGRLKPGEIEDCLCIYKERLKGMVPARPRSCFLHNTKRSTRTRVKSRAC